MSFFDDHSYYPDFIVWLAKGEDQHILFLDPKGLVRYGPNERRKVRLHVEIKEVEERVPATTRNSACTPMCSPSRRPTRSATSCAAGRNGKITAFTFWTTILGQNVIWDTR